MKALSEAFKKAVHQKLRADLLSFDAQDLETFGRDWTRTYPPKPSAIAFPRSGSEVAQLLALCSEHHVAVVPSGGRTGLAAGAVAAHGELVVSLTKMNALGEIDPLSQTVRVGAGAVTEQVHRHCEPSGLTWPVDFASKGSSSVGGNLSTNAGGVKVIRYGLTRQWVLGIQVATMKGELLEINGSLEKNNTGLDLKHLFIGTEGTLGIITEATLKLTRLPGEREVLFLGLSEMAQVFKLFLEARRSPFTIAAFETLSLECLRAVKGVRGLRSPFEKEHAHYVLIEIERPADESKKNQLEEWIVGLFESGLAQDGTIAQSPREAKELWELREGISECLSAMGKAHKNDISIPINQLEKFLLAFERDFNVRYPGLKTYIFGHIGDGNLHINTLPPQEMAALEFTRLCKESDEALFTLVHQFAGSISAEHGIGLLKKDALHFTKSSQEMDYLRQIKKVFDPQGLLNPGKIFD